MNKTKYVVCTHSFAVVVEVDSDLSVTDYSILSSGGHHYGVALKNRSFVVKQDSNVYDQYSLSGHNRTGSVRTPLHARYVHQICFAHGGYYVTDTDHNRIFWFQPDSSDVYSYNINGLDSDYNHVNSVFPCGNNLLVLLHNRGREPSEVVVLRRLSHDFEPIQRLRLWHGGCHNVFVDGQRLYYNASTDGRLVVVDIQSGTITEEISFPGHVKGLSVHNDTIALGVSEFAERKNRSTSRGRLAILNRHSLSVRAILDLDFDTLPHPIGNINEVRCLEGNEEGQSRRQPVPFDWADVSLNTPSLTESLRARLRRLRHRFRTKTSQI